MKTTTRANLHTISILSIGIMIGSFGFGNASADDTTTTTATAPTIPAGEMIKVCINKKSGAIRAATKCTTSERSSSLGGPGPQGPKGDVGSVGPIGLVGPAGPIGPKGDLGPTGMQGIQGVAGPTGMTGATGSVSGLRTKSITTMSTGFGSYCSSFSIGGASLLNGNSSISVSGSYVTLNKNCTNLTESSVTVYAP
jgi:hypothetical protein